MPRRDGTTHDLSNNPVDSTMARRSKAKKNRTGTIPTDSFSDIAFLLIIYFLVATTLVKLQAITADLPSGENFGNISNPECEVSLRATPPLELTVYKSPA
jgi:biopolymer transport protein ExbD